MFLGRGMMLILYTVYDVIFSHDLAGWVHSAPTAPNISGMAGVIPSIHAKASIM